MNFGKTFEMNTKESGVIIFRSIGAIDLTKVYPVDVEKTTDKQNKWQESYDPRRFFPKVVNNSTQNKDPEELLESIKKMEFFVPFQSDNKDWWEKNKTFFKEKLMASGKLDESKVDNLFWKPMILGGTVTEEKHISWYVVSREYLNDDWVKENSEYIAYMDKLVANEYEKMIKASEIGLRTGLLKANKLNLDFNYNDGAVVKNLIEKNNLLVLKYAVNSGAILNKEHILLAKNEEVKDFVLGVVSKTTKKMK